MLDIQEIYTPTSLTEALQLLHEKKPRVLAGGTDIVVSMRNRVQEDVSLMALGRIPELQGIRMKGQELAIGAMTPFTDIIEHELILKYMPVLSEACLTIASPQIRHAATIGGNIVNAAVSADSIPPLLLYDAEAEIQSVQGVRRIPLKDLFSGPGKTILQVDELLTAILIPQNTLGNLSAHYIKYSVRRSMDLAVLGIGVALSLQEGKLKQLRVALGVAAPVPLRLLNDEDWAGRVPDEDLLEEMIREIERHTKVRDSWRASREYREHLIPVLIREAFDICLKQAEDRS